MEKAAVAQEMLGGEKRSRIFLGNIHLLTERLFFYFLRHMQHFVIILMESMLEHGSC